MCARRQPVYLLHDGSPEAISGLSRMVDRLRHDPWALETVWLSFISLVGEAKIALPLTEIEATDCLSVMSAKEGASDLDGGLCLVAQDVHSNWVKSTATTKGDWRPRLAIVITSRVSASLSEGIKALEGCKIDSKFAFVGPAVSEEMSVTLNGAGFNVIKITHDGSMAGSGGQAPILWADFLSDQIGMRFAAGAPQARQAEAPPVELSARTAGGETGHASPPELTGNNMFNADLGKLSTDGRITRRGLMLYLLLYLGLIVVAVFAGYLSTTLASVVSTVALGVFLIGLIKRAHDVGLSGWFILVPFLGFWLFLVPGQSGSNKFGPDPR